MIYDFLL